MYSLVGLQPSPKVEWHFMKLWYIKLQVEIRKVVRMLLQCHITVKKKLLIKRKILCCIYTFSMSCIFATYPPLTSCTQRKTVKGRILNLVYRFNKLLPHFTNDLESDTYSGAFCHHLSKNVLTKPLRWCWRLALQL